MVIDAIKKNQQSLVKIVEANTRNAVSNTTPPKVVALGLVTSSTGKILADSQSLSDDDSYAAIFHDGRQFPVKFISVSANFARLEVVRDPIKDVAYVFYPAVTASSDSLQLGQTIIALGGKTEAQVTIGRVSLLKLDENSSTTSAASSTSPTSSPTSALSKPIVLIQTENTLKDDISGSLLLNLTGELVGVENWQPSIPTDGQFIPINVIKSAHSQFFDSPKIP